MTKKKKRIILIVSAIVVLLIIGALTSNNKTPEDNSETSTQTDEQLKQEPAFSEVTSSEEVPNPSSEEVTNDGRNEEIIILIADEQGEYGELFTINAGTEFEETYYIYRVPAGTYTVTLTGEYMDQFNVHGETVYVTEAGWEELSDVYYVKLFQPGESDTVTIEDGQIIEIHGNGVWELTLN